MLAGWARALLELDEAALVRIAFRDEPLRGKLTEAMKQSLYEGARAEGEARAALLQEDGGALSLDEAAARWGGHFVRRWCDAFSNPGDRGHG